MDPKPELYVEDEIIREVRRARLEILEEVGFDLDRLLERLMCEQKAHQERVVSFPSPWTETSTKDNPVLPDVIIAEHDTGSPYTFKP